MRYNRYLYRLPVQAVPITDIVKNSISSTNIVTDPIIGTSLIATHTNFRLHGQCIGNKIFNSDTKLFKAEILTI